MTQVLYCPCQQTALEISGEAIMSCECACTSCRRAAETFAGLSEGKDPRGPLGTTHFVLYRKDRVRCVAGAERIAEYRLEPQANTRRAVATCCNAPLFLEFKGGHWLSMYADLWPKETRPAAEMRTMVSDLPEGESLPNDIPNLRTHSIRFMFKLATAWAKMAFRAPKVDFIRGGTIDGSR